MNKKIGGNYMKRNGETGQVLVLAVLGLTVLMLAAGLSIDMGYLRYQRRLMQTAADSAAIAAATQLGGDFQDAATSAAGLNGFSPSSVAANQVPCPPYGKSNNCIQVTVSQSEPTFFMRIVGNNSVTVSAVAIAKQIPGLGCMYALSNAGDAIKVGYYINQTYNGFHAIIEGTTCGLVDNGGLYVDTGQTVSTESIVATPYYIAGAFVTPNPVPPPYQSSDPLANLIQTPKAPDACPGAPPTIYAPATGQTVAVPSGPYACGLTLSPTGGKVTLSGLYTIGGSGLTISGSGSVIDDSGQPPVSGVTLYVSGKSASVSINADADDGSSDFYGVTVHLQAPADATDGIPGVVLYQDPADTQTASVELAGFQWGGSATDPAYPGSYLWGAVYVPSATLMLGGPGNDDNSSFDKCASVPRLTTVVAYELVLEYNLNFSTNDCGPPTLVSTPVPALTQSAVLVQ
jgi:hypothetical protein